MWSTQDIRSAAYQSRTALIPLRARTTTFVLRGCLKTLPDLEFCSGTRLRPGIIVNALLAALLASLLVALQVASSLFYVPLENLLYNPV